MTVRALQTFIQGSRSGPVWPGYVRAWRIHLAAKASTAAALAGALSNLALLTTEQSLLAADDAVASSDTALIQDQIAVFRALGGGWRSFGIASR